MPEIIHSHEVDRSRSELEELKRRRLQYTVTYAYEHSPFYRELFDEHDVAPGDIREPGDVQHLPTVTGADIRENQPPVTDSHRFRTGIESTARPFATSGSMGQPKMIYQSDDEYAYTCAAASEFNHHFGVDEDDVVLNYLPNVGLNISGAVSESVHRRYGISSLPFHHTEFKIEQEAHLIRTHDVTCVLALASHALARGQKLASAGFDPSEFGIEKVLLTGEPVTEEKRETIEELFDATTYDMLGLTELWGIIAGECTESPYMHFDETLTHAEIVDGGGTPVEEGVKGSLTLTQLLPVGAESAMPLLRYQPGDVTEWHETGCECTYSEHLAIEPPTRAGWEFNLGAVVLDASYFENVIYDHDVLDDSVTDYQLSLDSEGENGIDRLEVTITTDDNSYVGTESIDVSVEDPAETVADELGQSFLRNRSTVHETVDIVGAAQIDVRFVDEIGHGTGKPDRLVDDR